MNEENKTNYEKALNDYIRARKELAHTQADYDRKRHAKRVQLYEAKASGVKLSEEAIRSMTITEFADLGEKVLMAQAEMENATAILNYFRDIYNKENN